MHMALIVLSKIEAAVPIYDIDQDELNKRVHIHGAMGNNITLTSNCTIGGHPSTFIVSGMLFHFLIFCCSSNDVLFQVKPLIAIKVFVRFLDSYLAESTYYMKMNATMDKVCEKYGIPFIYHLGDFLDHKTMAVYIRTIVKRHHIDHFPRFGITEIC